MTTKKKNEITIRSSAAEYLTFIASTGDGQNSFEMRYEDENIWLTQRMMATLYDVSIPDINIHIKKIYTDGELAPEATIKKYLIVQAEGNRQVSREVDHYSLQMIIAVGFKVNTERAAIQQPLIMTRMLKSRGTFSNSYRTKCTGLSTDIRRLN